MRYDEFMTEEGKATRELMNAYGLGLYYDVLAGNVTMTIAEFWGEEEKIIRFLAENDDWVMGIEHYTDEYTVFLCERDNV